MLVEEVYLKSLGASIQILILDETYEQWQIMRAFNRVLGSKDDVALKLYTTLLEEERKIRSRDLVTRVNKARYTIDKNLKNLMTLGLVGCDYARMGVYEFRSWYPEKHVLGMMRLIPAEYFKKTFPQKMLKKDE